MKIDFRNLEDSHIDVGRSFFLYGNNRKTFDVFCDFIYEKIQQKTPGAMRRFCTFGECMDIINKRCDLFGSEVYCFCIRSIDDGHLEKLPLLLAEKSSVFVMQSGDYAKSKKITEHVVKSDRILAIASFKNDFTLQSLCKMLLPNLSSHVRDRLVKIMNETDEGLTSFFSKMFLLLEDETVKLEEYIIDKRSFLAQMDFIPLVRYLQQYLLKEKISAKAGQLKITPPLEKATSSLLDAEIKQKLGIKTPKSHIYKELFCRF